MTDISTWSAVARGGTQILAYGPWALIIALMTMLLRERGQRRSSENAEDKQRAELAMQMIETARDEISRLNHELRDYRVLADVEMHLREAEEHLTALIQAEPSELPRAKRGAEQFLRRMQRLREARGTANNEVQIAVSKERLGKDGE